MDWHFLGKLFQIVCLVATGLLFIIDGSKYFRNEDSSLVEYRTFNDRKQDIYPSISICFYGLGIYDRRKLNETYQIEDEVKYMKFLEGDFWDENFLRVKYDDVTLDIKDLVDGIIVFGIGDWRSEKPLYQWAKNNSNTDDTVKGSRTTSKVTQIFPLRTTFRHAVGKCFSLDLSGEMIPGIQGQLISGVLIAFKTVPIPDIYTIQYMINYPGQVTRGFVLDSELAWSLRIDSGYVKGKAFLLDIIEVFRHRSTAQKPCKETGTDDDDTIIHDVIKMANCKPPHWNISMYYPICNSKEKMKNVTIEMSIFKHASPKFLKRFEPPCDGIQAATLNILVEQRQNVSSLWTTVFQLGEDSSAVMFHFKNERYKEIKYTRAFDFGSLVGDVGGYIGLLLGFAFWQLPDAIKLLNSKLSNLAVGKIYNVLGGLPKI